jgi:uncharacterized membrane-anchored protein YhcB (DUF1043 family)
MSTETFVFIFVALLVGAAAGAYVVHLLGKTKTQAAENGLRERLAEKEALVAEARAAVAEERRLSGERMDGLQRDLRDVVEAKGKLDGAGDSVDALKEELHARDEEIRALSEK